MKKKKGHIIALLLMLLLCGRGVKAQSSHLFDNANLLIEAKGHYGTFYQHHFEMERFNAHYPAFEFSLYKGTFGEEIWETLYNYPYIGCTFYYSALGNFEELGKVYALYPFINYPLLRGEKSMLTFKLGVGIGYITKKFDHIENHYNFAIGSSHNAAINLSFEYRQQIIPQLFAVGSFGLTHFSNGATHSPNYGLNTFSGALGLAYYLRYPNSSMTPVDRPQHYLFEFDGKKWFSYDVEYCIGYKDVSQIFGVTNYFLVHDLSAHFLAQFTTCSRAGIALDIVLDKSDAVNLQHNGIDIQSIRQYQMLRPSLALSYEMTMKRMSYVFDFGYHLNLRADNESIFAKPFINLNMLTDLSEGQVYQRVMARYQLYEGLFATFSLTSHAGRADFLGIGFGYRFNQKYYLNNNAHAKSTVLPPGLD